MCILFWALQQHPRYRFVFCSNRDEYLARPTAPASFWDTSKTVYGGRDLLYPDENGTWLGVSTSGQFAAMTNYREPAPPTRISRGVLVRDYLLGHASPLEYTRQLKTRGEAFNGFSLVCVDLVSENMAYVSNREESTVISLSEGQVYGLSNSVLSDPWPKVQSGCEQFKRILAKHASAETLIPALMDLLSTTNMDVRKETPLEEPLASSKETIMIPLIQLGGQPYATVSSSIVLVDHEGQVTFLERTWWAVDANGEVKPQVTDRQVEFNLVL